jgi:hypothetical protein
MRNRSLFISHGRARICKKNVTVWGLIKPELVFAVSMLRSYRTRTTTSALKVFSHVISNYCFRGARSRDFFAECLSRLRFCTQISMSPSQKTLEKRFYHHISVSVCSLCLECAVLALLGCPFQEQLQL